MPSPYLQKILTARVYEIAKETPLDYATNLSRRLNNHVFLKREDQQEIFSFKIRGAYNKMVKLPREVLKKGVVAASAGNHAQGVALAAGRLGCPATIVMPVTTPQIKINAVESLGGKVKLIGDSYDDASEYALRLTKKKKLVFIPPYDDPDIIAGQGTIGFEILKQSNEDLAAIFIPVGGGGLIAGIAAYVKQIRPGVKIIGVEPDDADSMRQSLHAGRRRTLSEVGLFADGVAVKQVGRETFRLARDLVDDVIVASTDEMCAAIKDVFEDTRTVMEPAGALSIAGLKKYVAANQCRNANLVAVASGANMNFDRLRHVSERTDIGERREAILAVTIPEKPGSFKSFCAAIGNRSVSEFSYRYSDSRNAHIYVGIKVNGQSEIDTLIRLLLRRGYETVDLTDNEMAKVHVRYMVGGRSPAVANEMVYRFRFPERPGALMDFLENMGHNWNISMFHYRNHGADYGRILTGIQVPPGEKSEFRRFLKTLGYYHMEETGNPAYQMFLG